jgi:hypothetical protein
LYGSRGRGERFGTGALGIPLRRCMSKAVREPIYGKLKLFAGRLRGREPG